MTSPGATRVHVATTADVPPGAVRVVEAAGTTVALFNVNGRYYALANACLHRGGPLGEGDVDGPIVTCPWHAWRWDVTTGANVNNPAVRMPAFPVVVENGDIFVEVPAR